MEKTIKKQTTEHVLGIRSVKCYHIYICHLFISISCLSSLWMITVGMTMVYVFNLPCPFYSLMFIAFEIVEVGLFAARCHVLWSG